MAWNRKKLRRKLAKYWRGFTWDANGNAIRRIPTQPAIAVPRAAIAVPAGAVLIAPQRMFSPQNFVMPWETARPLLTAKQREVLDKDAAELERRGLAFAVQCKNGIVELVVFNG